MRIVPHSTSFSRWLVRYQSEHKKGIIPAAFPLHLAAGGYEVRRLDLKAQCVLLDHCGCQKHWQSVAIPTSTNERRVVAVAQTGRERESSRGGSCAVSTAGRGTWSARRA